MNQSDMWARLKLFSIEHAKMVDSNFSLKLEWNVCVGAVLYFCGLTHRDDAETVAAIKAAEVWFRAGLCEKYRPMCERWFGMASEVKQERHKALASLVDMLEISSGKADDASRN